MWCFKDEGCRHGRSICIEKEKKEEDDSMRRNKNEIKFFFLMQFSKFVINSDLKKKNEECNNSQLTN